MCCPQGAERKMRDEERKRSKRRGKNANDANGESCKLTAPFFVVVVKK